MFSEVSKEKQKTSFKVFPKSSDVFSNAFALHGLPPVTAFGLELTVVEGALLRELCTDDCVLCAKQRIARLKFGLDQTFYDFLKTFASLIKFF